MRKNKNFICAKRNRVMSYHPNPYISQPQVNISFLQNFRVPYLMCPVCGNPPIKLDGVNYLTCQSHHQFHKCPTCFDTRVSDVRENVLYCGLLHPYHLCPIHKKPVMGVSQFGTKCTCGNNPRTLTRQRQIEQWESPFV